MRSPRKRDDSSQGVSSEENLNLNSRSIPGPGTQSREQSGADQQSDQGVGVLTEAGALGDEGSESESGEGGLRPGGASW